MERYQASARFDYAAPPCRRINVFASKPTSTAWRNCADRRCSEQRRQRFFLVGGVAAVVIALIAVLAAVLSGGGGKKTASGTTTSASASTTAPTTSTGLLQPRRLPCRCRSGRLRPRSGAPTSTARRRTTPTSPRRRPCASTPPRTVHGDDGHRRRDDHDQAAGRAKPDDREQLRVPGRLPLLRRDRVPPCL